MKQMKKNKQMSLKVFLLIIVTILTIGFTGCSDELSGDQTQGKPGYLTITVKTLKSLQTKVTGYALDDYKSIKNLNIFVFDGTSNNLLLNKYYTYGDTLIDGTQTENISVSSLPANAYVVVVANFGQRIDTITTYAGLQSIPIETVRNFANLGLHMTGKANIEVTNNGYSYISNVSIAPVESKITVDWTLTGDVLANYDVTGIYVVNAIDKTNLAIVRENIFNTTWGTPGNITPTGFINVISSVRTASTGLAAAGSRDYNFYGAMADAALLRDEVAVTFEGTAGHEYLPATYTALAPTHYYVGENYSNNSTIPNAGTGAILGSTILNAGTNENTLVVIRVTPLISAPAYIKAMGHKYYTYEFNKASNTINSTNLGTGAIGTAGSDVGFSVRRKTNYSLTFNLANLGTTNPFERLKNLQVNVTADAWDPANVTF